MNTGAVYIVGAGPGAADLITVRGRRLLDRADTIVVDDLVPRTFLTELGIDEAGRDVLWLGPGDTRDRQGEVNDRIRAAVREGRSVVRLKGGDPFVFGRADGEVAALIAQGLPCEVVPGLSACPAALTGAGMPATWRGRGRSFAAVTAQTAPGTDGASLPRADTVVAFMAVRALPEFVGRLMAGGWAPAAPAALIERATMPWERRVRAELGGIVEAAEREGVAPPALLVVGAAVEAAGALTARPTILYTGLDPGSFRFLGDVIHWPGISVVEEEGAASRTTRAVEMLGQRRFRWVVFTSPRSVQTFLRDLARRDLDARLLAGCGVAVAGPGTARRLAEKGVRADAVGEAPGGSGIALVLGPGNGRSLLLVQGTHAPAALVDGLERRGWAVFRLGQHRVIPHPELGRPLPPHDVIYFASPSAVRAYWWTYGADAFRREVWCIGDVTRRQLAGFSVEAKVVSPYVPADAIA
jgi:uroporphyrinogen III methyltransferase/synthase